MSRGQEAPQKQEDADGAPQAQAAEVLVIVDGTPITEEAMSQRFREVFGGQLRSMPPDQIEEFRAAAAQRVLDDLVVRTLVLNKANASGIKIADEAIEKVLKEIREALPQGADLSLYLTTVGITENQLKSNISDDLKMQKIIEDQTAGVGAPKPEEVRSFYDDNPAAFDVDESVRARHILIAIQGESDPDKLAEKKAKAEDVRKSLVEKNGENFAELASTMSDGPSKSRGGDLETFFKGAMVPEFDVAAFSQKVGEIGPVVETQFGYHIIQVQEKNPPRKLSFEEAQANIEHAMVQERKAEKMRGYLDDLRSKANIIEVEKPTGAKASG